MAINNAGIKLIQSFINVILTVTTLTYEATAAIINNDKALTPNGRPNTTSLIIPDKKYKTISLASADILKPNNKQEYNEH